MFKKILFSFVILSLLPLPQGTSFQEDGTQQQLTYAQVYENAEPRVFAPLERIGSWLDNEHYLQWNQEKNNPPRWMKVSARTGEKIIFLDYGRIQKDLPEGLDAARHIDETSDYSGLLYSFKGDIYYYSRPQNQLRRLTASIGDEMNPTLSPDGRFAAYTRDHNLYTIDISSGTEYQLTADGSDTIYNGWASWVYYEEILGRGSRYRAFWWSPDSSRLAFLRFDDSPVPVFPIFHHTRGVHGELEKERYPKPGDSNPYVKLGIISATGGDPVWADIEENADHYVAWPSWCRDSSTLTVQWMNRNQDHIKIFAVDPGSGEKREIYQEKQTSWVDFFNDLYFFEDGRGFLLRSSRDGWDHLYLYDLKGTLLQRLTQGPWTVTGIERVDEAGNRIFFQARKEKSTENHLFVISLDGSGLRRLTPEPGYHRCSISQNGSYFIDTYSNVHTPNRQVLFQEDGSLIRTIADSRSQQTDRYHLAKKELLDLPTRDGWVLPCYWILPPDFDENQQYPVLFTIYGGPGSSAVSNTYPSLSQLYFAQEGVIIFALDHRGSGHFGKKGMAMMHRNLGKWEMHDLSEAARWLRSKSFVNPDKIGITGGSYGGYTTCMALTYAADYFTHGYARASVTDWRLYDTVYTERYMDRPQDNPEGYKAGAVMTHADNLKGVLYMSHGAVDDNVHMQNTVQLISALMDLGKKFEFMIYPAQRHGYRGGKRDFSNRHYVDFWFRHFRQQ
jgi:dipeptidyl-peptidase 4